MIRFNRPARHTRRTLTAALILSCAAWGAESGSPKKAFRLPEGDAALTLKQFSQQAGEQIVYPVDLVRGVQTNPVHGEFTARHALERMVANTELVVIEEEKTGALTVKRKAREPPPTQTGRPAPPHPEPRSKTQSLDDPHSPMKKQTLLAALNRFASAVLIAGPGFAAQAPATPPPPTDEEAVVLSPFVVNSDKDVGYSAGSTLAGTRLNTSVKDIGASLSIYTKSFLNDVGATNANELFVYATGTESGGPQGNYSGAVSNINSTTVFTETPRVSPQNATRIRGLSSPNYTRGLFNTSIPMDSFNTETVTINRGPNAILFGVGSPAGVVDATLLQANLTRNLNNVEVRYGNNDSLRGAIDLNRVLIPNKFVLRIAALNDREEFNQRPAYEHKRRIFSTVTAKPFRATTVRGNFEAGRTRANRPLTVLPLHSVSPYWYDGGRPVHDWTFHDDPTRNPNAANEQGGSLSWGFLSGFYAFGEHIGMIYDSPTATTISNAYRGTLRETPGTVADAVRSNLFHPVVNRDLRAESVIQGPATRNIAEIAPGFFLPGLPPAGIKPQGFTELNAFDFKGRMLDELGWQRDTYHTFNVALEQLAWRDRLGIELAYHSERYDARSNSPFMSGNGNGHVRVDAAAVLPTGQPNPNVGRPFMLYTQAQPRNTFTLRETARATAFARYDFKEASPRFRRWLGRHTVTGLYEEYATDNLSFSTRLVATGPAADSVNPAPDAFARQAAILVYIGDSILDGRPLRLSPVQIPLPQPGLTAPTTYFAAPNGSAAQGDFAVVPTTLEEIMGGGQATREVIKSQAVVLQSYWLADHLVTTFGWRRDEDFFASQTISYNRNDPGRVAYGFTDFDFPSTPPPAVAKEIKSYSAVLRWPQKLARLPFGADAGVFFNSSENFTPLGGRRNPYNEPLPSPQGKTREYGLNVSVLNDRLVLRVNRFETSITGQTFAGYGNALNNSVLQHAGFWATEANVNPHIDRSADIELMFSVLPPNFRELYQWRVTGSAAQQNLAASHTLINGLIDTTDYTAKGTEAELTFSPNRQWRFLVNVANQETVQSNIAPGLREFVARMRPVWDRLANVPSINYPPGHVLGNPLPSTILTHGQYRTQNVDIPLAAAIASEGTASAEQRKWRANFIANYAFATDTRLKGWSVGGAIRWQDKLGLGYPTDRTPEGVISFDLEHPYYSPAETNVDLFLAYTRKLYSNRIDWKAQLNVRNAIGDGGLMGVTVQPWGEHAITRLPPERRWYLTNSFSF